MELDKELQEDIKNLVKKTVVFIKGSSIPDDIKASWIRLLPEMSLEQIVKLHDTLETKYLDEKTQDVNDQLKVDLKKVVDKFEVEERKLDDEFLSELNKLEKSLNE